MDLSDPKFFINRELGWLEFNQRVLDHIPAERWGEPVDLMGALVYLSSRASNYVNGHLLVVDGGIYRHEFVAQSVVSGLMQVQLETEVPVFSVSLTPHHFHAGSEHHTFFYEHFVHKGQEAAKTCADTLRKVRAIRRSDEPQKLAV